MDSGLGWQGWLWVAILAVCLGALALGLGFRHGTESTEGSTGEVSSSNVGSTVDVPQTINLFPASTERGTDSEGAVPPTSTPAGDVPPTTVLGSSTDAPSTSRPSTVSSSSNRPSTLSTTTTSRPTTISVTTVAAQSVRLASTATASSAVPSTATPSTRPTTSTSKPGTTTTRSSGPLAVDDYLAVEEGKEAKPKVLDNDAPGDASLDEGTLSIAAGPANAESYKVHNDHLHYKPADGFVGVDRIRYRICDDAGRCDTATVSIAVG